MPRDELDAILKRIGGHRSGGLGLDDIAEVVASLMREQKKDILAHVQRLLTLQEFKSSDPKDERRDHNTQRRLLQLEAAVRRLERAPR
jgi:hypothetical protein